jgi:hypothetical protein
VFSARLIGYNGSNPLDAYRPLWVSGGVSPDWLVVWRPEELDDGQSGSGR